MRANRSISLITLVVQDYDEAIAFFVEKLRFFLIQDEVLSDEKRWVVVSASQTSGSNLLLAKARDAQQLEHIGNQTGGRVCMFLETGDFWEDYHYMQSQGVTFLEQPREEKYGTVVVFQDLYGNKWDLIQKNNDLWSENVS